MNKNGHYTITTSIASVAIAVAPNILSHPEFWVCLGVYFLGGLFPDMDMRFKVFFQNAPYWKYHRQITHSLFIFIPLSVWGFYENIYVFAFCMGVFSHLIPDMITGNVPFLAIWNKSYQSGFPWRIGFKIFGKDGNKTFVETFEKLSKKILFPLSVITLLGLILKALIV